MGNMGLRTLPVNVFSNLHSVTALYVKYATSAIGIQSIMELSFYVLFNNRLIFVYHRYLQNNQLSGLNSLYFTDLSSLKEL